MRKIEGRYLKKIVVYEVDYLRRKLKITQAFIFIISIFSLVITGFGDTTSFFIGEQSPIPREWILFKNEYSASVISVIIILLLYLIVWALDLNNKAKEDNELASVIKDNVIPGIELELKELKKNIKTKHRLVDNIRLSIFVPVRAGLFKWNLQMVCRTNNISERELLAKFKLYEGVLGYTYLKTKKHSMEFIDISNSSNLPVTYTPLKQENSNLINRTIIGM
ncbi:hypothetical protein Cylst_3135 [Cylindrospermum stagnale PCC 7417]|uniref:Uncharacterized protein n=1 Tax=Cylindrospermum stagnale PCC 7417 TaxID=56107 RepID=K9WZS8_9NOST|nr:hypothetical protein Cylst_3135 [Cylindrospermum stagnale PCC 7417]